MNLKNTIAVILGGGRGTRLFPLTLNRAKPAVPLGGKYRLIDIAISNCLYAGIDKIFVLTQFNSASLNRHIFRTYRFSEFSQGFIEIMPAELSLDNMDWYQGTADAVRQNIKHFQYPDLENYLILGGDQMYKMDLRHLIRVHQNSGSDITIAVLPVSGDMVRRFGVVRLDRQRKVVAYQEKPESAAAIPDMIGDRALLPEGLLRPPPTPFFWASMGIYVMRRSVLEELLQQRQGDDFERDILPYAVNNFNIQGFLFTGYWEDLGTISSFYKANMAMLNYPPPINLYDNTTRVYTRQRHLPPSLCFNSRLESVLVADGCKLINCTIRNSIVGIRSVVKPSASIENAIIMGADYFDTNEDQIRRENIPLGIGERSVVRNAIIDKNVRIGQNVIIDNPKGITHKDDQKYYIREGIVVIPKAVVLPDNFRIDEQLLEE